MSEARKMIEEPEEREVLEDVACFDDESAEYLLRRIREANAQYERMESWYQLQLQKCAEIRERTVAWAERGLRYYLEMNPAAKKTKTQISYELPGGKMVLKAQEPEFERDEDALVKWMEKNGMDKLVKVKKTSNWAELKKTLKADGDCMVTKDGEVVPGIKVVKRDPKFTVTVK